MREETTGLPECGKESKEINYIFLSLWLLPRVRLAVLVLGSTVLACAWSWATVRCRYLLGGMKVLGRMHNRGDTIVQNPKTESARGDRKVLGGIQKPVESGKTSPTGSGILRFPKISKDPEQSEPPKQNLLGG